MASQSAARSESIAAFIPALELLITEAMEEWKIPGLAITVVQNGEVAQVGAYGLQDVKLRLEGDNGHIVPDRLDHEVVHLHGLGPLRGRAAPCLEEAGAGRSCPAVRTAAAGYFRS
jgi:hypothetical protein